MKRTMRSFPSRTVVAAVVVSLLVGGIGSATAARLITGKQIKNGSIQFGDLSKQAKKKLRGQRGLRGSQGAAGAQGAQGPSDAFTTKTPGPTTINTTDTTIESLNLEAGKYLVLGRLSMQGTQQIVRCNISPSDSALDATVTLPGGGFQDESDVHDTVTLAAAGTVVFRCHSATSAVTGFEIVLTAVKVGNVTQQ